MGLLEPTRTVHRFPFFDFHKVSDAKRLCDLLSKGAKLTEIVEEGPAEEAGLRVVHLRIGVVLVDDRPVGHPWFRKGWLSQRDLLQLVNKSLESNIVFGIYYGMSNNTGGFWDITNARLDLGYEPQDDASDYWQNQKKYLYYFSSFLYLPFA